MRLTELPERLAQKIMPVQDGCWLWTAWGNDWHGRYKHKGRDVPAHRVVYERLVGPIPEGLELDHLCRQTWCVNPRHVEPVTHLENMRRSVNAEFARRRRQTHCKYGHPLSGANLIRKANGRRQCRECSRRRSRDYARRKRAGGSVVLVEEEK